MVPAPVEAIIFLFPITEAYEKFKNEEEAHLTKCEQSISPDVIFFKQTIVNSCGMMALLHSVASNDHGIVGKMINGYKMRFIHRVFTDRQFRSWSIQ